jgi:hypothetical protein
MTSNFYNYRNSILSIVNVKLLSRVKSEWKLRKTLLEHLNPSHLHQSGSVKKHFFEKIVGNNFIQKFFSERVHRTVCSWKIKSYQRQ